MQAEAMRLKEQLVAAQETAIEARGSTNALRSELEEKVVRLQAAATKLLEDREFGDKQRRELDESLEEMKGQLARTDARSKAISMEQERLQEEVLSAQVTEHEACMSANRQRLEFEERIEDMERQIADSHQDSKRTVAKSQEQAVMLERQRGVGDELEQEVAYLRVQLARSNNEERRAVEEATNAERRAQANAEISVMHSLSAIRHIDAELRS
mmetsp:Transcript_57744/g.126720  ORF Transcript_57744/g.126720 Transcript_57744/m.126720 type:complete len:213 (+) Transcript_57744:1-639(+)